jgi:hypothetical protein
MDLMSDWLNNKKIIWEDTSMVDKPCHELNFCPYGQLVEEFPLREKRNQYSCTCFGHDCPVFYHGEMMMEAEHASR